MDTHNSESPKISDWLTSLDERHRSTFTSSEFLKALRALSARYVERRSQLPDRSPIDSAGKRAAFAAFYAPLHFFTTLEIARALRPVLTSRLIDLGCGTGVVSAAWAFQAAAPTVIGIDSHSWALGEAKWNWRQLGLRGEARRADFVLEAERLLRDRRDALGETTIIAGWSVNELDAAPRERLLEALVALGRAGAAILVIEPVARSATRWWDRFVGVLTPIGARNDEWRFDTGLPAPLRALDEAAGFRRQALTAKSLWVAPHAARTER